MAVKVEIAENWAQLTFSITNVATVPENEGKRRKSTYFPVALHRQTIFPPVLRYPSMTLIFGAYQIRPLISGSRRNSLHSCLNNPRQSSELSTRQINNTGEISDDIKTRVLISVKAAPHHAISPRVEFLSRGQGIKAVSHQQTRVYTPCAHTPVLSYRLVRKRHHIIWCENVPLIARCHFYNRKCCTQDAMFCMLKRWNLFPDTTRGVCWSENAKRTIDSW